MTKVLPRGHRSWAFLILLAFVSPHVRAFAQQAQDKPAEALYLQLGDVGLDPSRVYKVRGASIDRSSVQITLEDGTIAFTQDVMGRITGAFFEGYGEILLAPPSDVERRSMGLFTGMAILAERFQTGYFRFNDATADELKPGLRAPDDKQEFLDRWSTTAKNLASADAMRLLTTFSRMLPVNGKPAADNLDADAPTDRFLHARLQGDRFGVFDVFFDSTVTESIQVGQEKTSADGQTFYDVWASFAPPNSTEDGTDRNSTERRQAQNEKRGDSALVVRKYTITTEVVPPKQIHARAVLQCDARQGRTRTLLFELSRFLQVESVRLNGQPLEFIHNPAIEGSQLSRRGNDLVAVILPEPLKTDQQFQLEFDYGGEVLAEAGGGLLYVGARGTWYPNRGMEMSDFDLQFTYPDQWTLVATGKPTPVSPDTKLQAGQQASRWVSERAIPLAGFNLGRYRQLSAHAGAVDVETYATQGVERNFPSPPVRVVQPNPYDPEARRPEVIVPSKPSPAQNAVTVSDSAVHAIEYYAQRFGPYPYSRLSLTQMPGHESQGWPGLVFLSSYAFLTPEERNDLHFPRYLDLLQQSIPAHETAHQWWGDLITWKTYRDQWFSEGLANYCALMMLEERDLKGFHEIMEKYRTDLMEKNKDGVAPMDAGPVTLGSRLLSSRFPEGYEAISYGRGTWLFHMLRTMLKDAQAQQPGKTTPEANADEPFVRALRKLRERYEGKAITTRELLSVFAENLPPSLRYEGKESLDWFLDGWINGTSLPKLELKSVKFSTKGKRTVVSGTILQKQASENLVTSVPVYAVTTGKPVFLGRVFADGEESSFHLTAPAGARRLVLDPYDTILTSGK